jgi:nucleoside-diphosphate-sugar epimerase
MNILVVGGTGFIGAPLVRRLHEDGHAVAVFHRGETEADLPGDVRRIHGDRDDLAASRSVLTAVDPEVVVDVVPYTATQARQVVDVLGDTADRLVAVSSSDVYRNYDGWGGKSDHDPDPVPLTVDAPVRERRYPYRGIEDLDFAYAHDYEKLDVEKVVREAESVAATILRLPAVYGSGDAQHRLGPYVRRMADDRPAILLDERQARWRWTHGYVENVAAAIACAATDDRAAGRTYNVGEAHTPPQVERILELGAVAGWEGAVVSMPGGDLPDHLQAPFDWSYELATDTRRLREELGFSNPVSRTDALRATLDWERTHLPATDTSNAYTAEDAALSGLDESAND